MQMIDTNRKIKSVRAVVAQPGAEPVPNVISYEELKQKSDREHKQMVMAGENKLSGATIAFWVCLFAAMAAALIYLLQ